MVADENKAKFIPCDVSKPEEVENLFKEIKKEFGRLDVLINNAGFGTTDGKITETPNEAYHKIMDSNLHGSWYTLKLIYENTTNGGKCEI